MPLGINCTQRSVHSPLEGAAASWSRVPVDQSGQPTANPGDPSLWGANWQAAKGGGAAVHVPRLADTVPCCSHRHDSGGPSFCSALHGSSRAMPATTPQSRSKHRLSCRVTVSIPLHSESSLMKSPARLLAAERPLRRRVGSICLLDLGGFRPLLPCCPNSALHASEGNHNACANGYQSGSPPRRRRRGPWPVKRRFADRTSTRSHAAGRLGCVRGKSDRLAGQARRSLRSFGPSSAAAGSRATMSPMRRGSGERLRVHDPGLRRLVGHFGIQSRRGHDAGAVSADQLYRRSQLSRLGAGPLEKWSGRRRRVLHLPGRPEMGDAAELKAFVPAAGPQVGRRWHR